MRKLILYSAAFLGSLGVGVLFTTELLKPDVFNPTVRMSVFVGGAALGGFLVLVGSAIGRASALKFEVAPTLSILSQSVAVPTTTSEDVVEELGDTDEEELLGVESSYGEEVEADDMEEVGALA